LQYLWIGAAVAAVVAALPIAAVILVTLASHHEESVHSLSGEAPGPTDRIARRVLGFKTAHAGRLAPGQMPTSSSRSPRSSQNSEVRFVHARRPVSDPSEYRADRQSPEDRIRFDQRQRAGV
jgi:hypothetical protein